MAPRGQTCVLRRGPLLEVNPTHPDQPATSQFDPKRTNGPWLRDPRVMEMQGTQNPWLATAMPVRVAISLRSDRMTGKVAGFSHCKENPACIWEADMKRSLWAGSISWIAATAVALTVSTSPAAAQSPSPQYCQNYAHNYAQGAAPGGGVVRGAARGAARGAVVGGIFGDSDNDVGRGAGIGAGLGAMRGGAQQSQARQDAYNYAYQACMSGQVQ